MIRHDELLVQGEWPLQILKYFKVAIARYIQLLEPLRGGGNKKIEDEIKFWNDKLTIIQEELKRSENDSDEGKLPMLGKHYGTLLDLLWKYYSYKNQALEERKRKILSEAAHEGAQNELNELNSILQLDFWNTVNRKPVLVPDFHTEENSTNKSSSPGQQILSIGILNNMNGQFVGFNSGNLSQSSEIEIVLNKLSDVISKEVPAEIKQEALADVLTLNAQVAGGKPHKEIMKTTLEKLKTLLKNGLTYGAAAAQIYQMTIQPYLLEIKKFIDALPGS